MLINKISFPYPVLNNADDVNGEFGFNFDVELSPETIILTVKINLDNDSFKKLLKEKKVAFCLEVHNSQAFFRESYVFEDYDKKFTLLSKNLRGKVDVYLYIIAIDNIKDYSLSEFNSDYIGYVFDILKGEKLAMGGHGFFMAEKTWADFMSVSSFIEIQGGPNKEGPAKYNLDNDDKVLVILSKEDYKKYQMVYTNEDIAYIFHSAIVYPALIYILSCIVINKDSDNYKQTNWYLYLTQRFANEPNSKNITDLDITEISEFAQKLLKNPLSRSLSSIDKLRKYNSDID